MNNRLIWVLTILTLLTFSSCRKKVVPVVSATPPPETSMLVNVYNLDFSNFSSKGKLTFEDATNKLSSPYTIRIKKDSLIWVSVIPAMGIEAVRAKITRDSVLVLNRLNREYYRYSIKFLKEQFNVDADFDMLQAMLLGNYISKNAAERKMVTAAPFQQIREANKNLVIDQYIDQVIYKLAKLEMKDTNTQTLIRAEYKDFEALQEIPFAKTVNIVVEPSGEKKTKSPTVNLSHTKITINDPQIVFPFSVPSDYERK